MPSKTPPFPPYPVWTTARFFGFIRSGLREKFNRWPPKYEVIKKVARETVMLDKNKRVVTFKTGKRVGQVRTYKEYQCAHCNEWHRQKEVQVDHIVPAGQLKSFSDISIFAEKLFVGEGGLQVLCYPCHEIKTRKDKNENT